MKKYSLFIGRFQCLPPHEGHEKLIRTILDEGKDVCIALRNTVKSEDNPYSVEERVAGFAKVFKKEMDEGRLIIISIPDITEVCYGRKVGYEIREISLDAKTESVSATEKRRQTAVLSVPMDFSI